MLDMDVWDAVLLCGAVYVAVTSLVRLMKRRREGIVDELIRLVDLRRREMREREREEARRRWREQSIGRRPKSRDAA